MKITTRLEFIAKVNITPLCALSFPGFQCISRYQQTAHQNSRAFGRVAYNHLTFNCFKGAIFFIIGPRQTRPQRGGKFYRKDLPSAAAQGESGQGLTPCFPVCPHLILKKSLETSWGEEFAPRWITIRDGLRGLDHH